MRKSQKKNTTLCDISTANFCKKAKNIGGLYLGKCHAGLMEAVFPLYHEHLLIGYIMFGQIHLSDDTKNYDKDSFENPKCINGVVSKSLEEIKACTVILEAIAHLIMVKNIANESKHEPAVRLAEYIKNNLDKDLSIKELSKRFAISRSELYNITKNYMPYGIAKYIKNIRLQRAKELLKNTDMSIQKISNSIGYSDYNYFSKDFKKTFNISAKDFRK